MGKSARILGLEFGKNAQEMNKILHEYGYLEGEPGAWRPTEKGELYAEEHSHSNGYGGWAARNWETRTWDDSIVDQLKQDMDKPPEPRDEVTDDSVEDNSDVEIEDDTFSQNDKEGSSLEMTLGIGIIALAVASQLKPHVKPMYVNKIKPAAQRIYEKFGKK